MQKREFTIVSKMEWLQNIVLWSAATARLVLEDSIVPYVLSLALEASIIVVSSEWPPVYVAFYVKLELKETYPTNTVLLSGFLQ